MNSLRIIVGVFLCACATFACAQESTTPQDTTPTQTISTTHAPAQDTTNTQKKSIYGGTIVKIDIASPILTPALNKWEMQHYELAANIRLAQRFYPTIEIGYTGGKTNKGDSIMYAGQGGFIRLGCDINPLKKHPESPHALLVGVRVGTAVQTSHHNIKNSYTQKIGVRADCWGEIVAGCQVEIAKVGNCAFFMGLMGRFKILFTREKEGMAATEMAPIYIPGYAIRNNTGWGVSYHLGWKF